MQWSDIPFQPTTKALRQFAVLWLVFFGGMATWQYARTGNSTLVTLLALLALTVGPIGLWKPSFLRPIYVGWMVLAFPIGWIVSRVLLAILFFGVFTPMALWFRLMGRDLLDLRRRPDLESYWMPKPLPGNVRTYFRQF